MKEIYHKTLTGSGMWSAVVSRHKRLRLEVLEEGANVGMMLYNALERQERYNMPDTLKGQHIFYLREPYALHTDMGRLVASITGDSVGWHDTVCGYSDAKLVQEKYGERSFQDVRNEFYRNGRDCFLIELAKWGLGKKDLITNVNWFSKVVSDEEGGLNYVENHSEAGDFIELRFEMDTLVVLNTCQHPLAPGGKYHCAQVDLKVFEGEEAQPDDATLQVRPENLRAWENNVDYHTLRF